MRMVRYALLTFVLLASLVLSACGDEEDSKSDSSSTEADKPVIKLAEMPWISAEANIGVAKVLLEGQLGYTVELVPVSTTDQWAGIAAGEIHAQLEIWPMSSVTEFQQYVVTDQTIEDGGELGPVGKGGWFVPYYMLEDHPELRSWEAFLDPEIVALFATEETGTQGRLISGDPAWVHSQYAEAIVRNLGLDFQIVYAGSEQAELDMIGTAYENQEPLLLYFWTPHWMFALYDLAEVELPPYSDECYATLEDVACAYPADHLRKVFWPGLKEYAPEAYQFLSNFNYSSTNQIQVMALVEIDGMTVEDAARRWVDNNEDIWREWMP